MLREGGEIWHANLLSRGKGLLREGGLPCKVIEVAWWQAKLLRGGGEIWRNKQGCGAGAAASMLVVEQASFVVDGAGEDSQSFGHITLYHRRRLQQFTYVPLPQDSLPPYRNPNSFTLPVPEDTLSEFVTQEPQMGEQWLVY